MRVILLDRILKKLRNTSEETLIYGFSTGDEKIACSFEERKGLEQVGIFTIDINGVKERERHILRDYYLFTMENGNLSGVYFLINGDEEEAEIEIINYTTDFNNRNHGIIDESVLQEKTVTVVGLGSGGSPIVLDLIRCGVTNLNLIEFDRVSISNLCRSVYALPDIGKKKTEVLHEKILRINPCVNIQLYDEDILQMEHEKLRKIIDESDLVIEATDSVKTKLLMNGLAYHNTPVLYPAVYDFGKGGDIAFTVPGATPCYECVFNSILSEMQKVKKGEWDYSTGQAKPMPALIADIKVVASRTVKLALALLTGDKENSFIEKVTEKGCSLLLIGNEKNFFIFDKPFQEVWAETHINPECSCQTLC